MITHCCALKCSVLLASLCALSGGLMWIACSSRYSVGSGHPTEEVVISEAGPWDQQEACFCKESAAAPVLGELGIDPRVG